MHLEKYLNYAFRNILLLQIYYSIIKKYYYSK